MDRQRPHAIKRARLQGICDWESKKKHNTGFQKDVFRFECLLYDAEEAGNSNGKMSARSYVDHVLEPVIKPWVEDVKLGSLAPFTLVEDPNGSNGVGVNSEARRWKREHSRGYIDYHFNERASPDLTPVEECWQPYKYDVKGYPHWEESYAKELVLDGWEHRLRRQYRQCRGD